MGHLPVSVSIMLDKVMCTLAETKFCALFYTDIHRQSLPWSSSTLIKQVGGRMGRICEGNIEWRQNKICKRWEVNLRSDTLER